jgi:hypothetical protein
MRLQIDRGAPRAGLFVVLLAVALTSSGCVRYYWYKPGLTAPELAGDNADCQRAAADAAAKTASGPEAGGAEQRGYAQCMQGRGYDLLKKKTIEELRTGKTPSLSS